jgi:hypothetical protein
MLFYLRSFLLIACSVFFSCLSSVSGAPITIYDTGVDNQGNLLAAGAQDTHYTLIQSPTGGQNTYVAVGAVLGEGSSYGVPTNWPFAPGPWISNTSNAQWIAPQSDVTAITGVNTTYIYQTTFDLTGFNPSTASLSGLWTVDDYSAGIYLNGNLVPNSMEQIPAVFSQFLSLSITSGFVAGINTLDFVIVNTGAANQTEIAPNPTGLIVEIAGHADRDVVPEPETLFSLAFGLLLMGVFCRRQKGCSA